jgi:hypothetical protein
MAELDDTKLTLLDWQKRQDPNGMVAQIVEMMAQKNEILMDIPWTESNEATSHMVTTRTSLPTGTYRRLNEGVSSSKSTTAQFRETLAMLEDYSKVDKAVMNLNGNAAAFRASEDSAFLEGLAQTVANRLFYGNSLLAPEEFDGLSPRYNALSGIENAENIINGGGSGTDNTSLWLIGWAPRTIHGIFPKGGQGGLQANDLGEDTLIDANGREFQGFRTHFKWDHGVAVEDWRYAVRLCNIDLSDIATAGDSSYSGINLINKMIDMISLMHSTSDCTPVFYCNRKIKAALDKLATNKANLALSFEMFAGKPVTMFQSIPIRRCDALLNTEAVVA